MDWDTRPEGRHCRSAESRDRNGKLRPRWAAIDEAVEMRLEDPAQGIVGLLPQLGRPSRVDGRKRHQPQTNAEALEVAMGISVATRTLAASKLSKKSGYGGILGGLELDLLERAIVAPYGRE